MAIAAGYVVLAMLSLLAPQPVRIGWWLPLHLLLAGGAAVAIAGVMPFFSAAVASVPAAPAPLRIVGVAGVAAGAALVVLVRLLDDGALVVGAAGLLAGGVYLVGVAAVAAATLMPLRLALGSRRRVLAATYGMAILCLALGVGLGTMTLVGWGPILETWGTWKPAHAWLNVFGFLSLVIGATLLHLLPTVAGSRIERTRATTIVLVALIVGPPATALGFLIGADIVVMAGSFLELVGALALLWTALDVVGRRGRWTTEPGWHRFTLGSLVCAVGWFVVGTALATAAAWSGGATGRGWDGSQLLAPLALGWAAQALMGSWSHLVPSIGPGSPFVHGRQRRILGQLSTPRLVIWQSAVGLVLAGQLGGIDAAGVAGLLLAVGCALLSFGLLGAALAGLWPGRSPSPSSG